MNGLRAKSRTEFSSQQQWRLEHTLHCTQVIRRHQTAEVDGPVLIQCPPGAPSDGCLGRLQDWLDDNTGQNDTSGSRIASKPKALVKVVVIDHLQEEIDEHLLLGIHHITFDELFREFELDDYLLYLLLRNVDGFYNIDQKTQPHRLDTQGASLYVSIRGFYTVVWKTHPEKVGPDKCVKTNAIIICRPDLVKDLMETLDVYKELAGHPLMLLLVCAGHLLQEIDKKVFAYLRIICETEEQTGFSREINPSFHHSSHRDKRLHESKEDDLGHLSATISSTLAGLALYLKHLKLATAITEILAKPPLRPLNLTDDHDLQTRDVIETAEILHRSSKMTTQYVLYLQTRAEIQQSVLANLIAKQDATAAISLAEDSKRLAVAAGNESFSLQTLAVVTMAFLPATFLATVFAMPIMKWEQGMGSVMRPELGLYFGLSVPITLAIFLGWAYLTRRRKQVTEKKENESRRVLQRRLHRGRQDFIPSTTVPAQRATKPERDNV